jgi:prepilin-type N-terminal cleavage/methylation domain-containing protein
MKRHQSGFTLIEIAIVLVIIGLLLGGVLKGQELINSAKVKNLASDFKNTALFIYSYQDKYHTLPGDDPLATNHVTGATTATTPAASIGNSRIDGKWDSATNTDESFLFWQQVRLSGIVTGVTDTTDTIGYRPRNTTGGLMGVTNSTAADLPIANLKGAYIICSAGVLGKFAKQLDIALDDGNTATGTMMAIPDQTTAGTVNIAATATASVDDTLLYTVCQGI